MRITEKQLKQIIREESQKALNEGGLEDTYTKKVSAYREALGQVGAAIAALQRAGVESEEIGDDPDIRSATLDLMEVQFTLRKFMNKIAALGRQ